MYFYNVVIFKLPLHILLGKRPRKPSGVFFTAALYYASGVDEIQRFLKNSFAVRTKNKGVIKTIMASYSRQNFKTFPANLAGQEIFFENAY
jgi:hypothetical protein